MQGAGLCFATVQGLTAEVVEGLRAHRALLPWTELHLHSVLNPAPLCLQQAVSLGMLCGSSGLGGLWEATVKGCGSKSGLAASVISACVWSLLGPHSVDVWAESGQGENSE